MIEIDAIGILRSALVYGTFGAAVTLLLGVFVFAPVRFIRRRKTK